MDHLHYIDTPGIDFTSLAAREALCDRPGDCLHGWLGPLLWTVRMVSYNPRDCASFEIIVGILHNTFSSTTLSQRRREAITSGLVSIILRKEMGETVTDVFNREGLQQPSCPGFPYTQ